MKRGIPLFVYGTLRRLLRLRGLRPLGAAWIQGRLYDFGRYPGWRRGGSGSVAGELFPAPSESLLRWIDEYEGHRFRRVQVLARRPQGDVLTAWAYEYTGSVGGVRRA